MKLNIIFEDKNIIIVEKPSKIPAQSDKTGDEDLMTLLTQELKAKSNNNREVNLGLVHRLDRPVGGVMVFAKTKESNSKLSRQISDRSFNKEYLAIVCGTPEQPSGELRDYLKKLITINMSKVVPEDTKNAKEAILEYKVLQTVHTEDFGDLSLLHIKLKTGRHHQIRVQLSNAGFPLWGDNKYNKVFVKMKTWTQIALWAYKISFKHPINNKPMEFSVLPSEEYPWNLFEINP